MPSRRHLGYGDRDRGRGRNRDYWLLIIVELCVAVPKDHCMISVRKKKTPLGQGESTGMCGRGRSTMVTCIHVIKKTVMRIMAQAFR